MKRNFVAITLTALFFSIALTGCEKDDLTNSKIKSLKYNSLDIDLIENPYTIDQHLNNLENTQETSMDRKLFQIATCLKDFFKTTDLNEYIISHASLHTNNCIDLRDFEKWEVLNKSEYSSEMIKKASDEILQINLTHISDNPNASGLEQYIPAIFAINAETADPMEIPIIGTGVMANEELPNMNDCEDCMIVWFFDEATGQFVEGLLSEEMALRTSHPIFIIDNADEALTERPKQNNDVIQEPFIKQGTSPEERFYLSSNEFKINIRYETTGKSEFCITGIHVTEDGTYGDISRSADYYKDYHLVSKVSKNDIGVQLNKWVDFCKPYCIAIPDLYPMQYNYIYWNSFERDWARTKKPLGTIVVYNQPYYLYGNMHYISDWYAFDPDNLQNNRLDIENIYYNGSQLFENNKGSIKIWRKDR